MRVIVIVIVIVLGGLARFVSFPWRTIEKGPQMGAFEATSRTTLQLSAC